MDGCTLFILLNKSSQFWILCKFTVWLKVYSVASSQVMIVPAGINEGVLSQTGIMLIDHSYKIQANACQSAIKIHE